ncbi:MAG: class I SAM-dependent methyltransferase [Sphingopyxis sp.]|nr:class I SAM-dependent methyltransferase [Sphingopyxis sp.]
MTYKDALYDTYVSSHIAHRKGISDPRSLAIQSKIFDGHFGRLLPLRREKVADLGCGPGTLVAWLKNQGFTQVSGVDFSHEQVANAHALGLEEVVQGDIFDFLSTNKDFDLLFARDVIEHFDRQMVFDFLAAARGALRPGGRLILQVPNAQSPYFGRVRYGDFTHELAFTAGSMRQVLNAVGYSSASIHPWRPVAFNLKSRVRSIAWRLLEPVLQLPIVVESATRDPIVTMNLIAVAEK